MTARAVLQAAQLDGVNLFLDAAGVLKISGNTEAVKKHADIIRAQKNELLDLLTYPDLTAAEIASIRAWCISINETDKAAIDAALVCCNADIDDRAYYLHRAQYG
jgi:hypothetical protein